jgi:hypothetical protein
MARAAPVSRRTFWHPLIRWGHRSRWPEGSNRHPTGCAHPQNSGQHWHSGQSARQDDHVHTHRGCSLALPHLPRPQAGETWTGQDRVNRAFESTVLCFPTVACSSDCFIFPLSTSNCRPTSVTIVAFLSIPDLISIASALASVILSSERSRPLPIALHSKCPIQPTSGA